MRTLFRLVLPGLLVLGMLATATSAGASHNPDRHKNMDLLSTSPTGATNSDLAFWGDRAYVGNYGGFRIFDISDPAHPQMLSSVACDGPQNDVSVWANRILVLSVDRTMAGPQCGAARVAHDDPNGWEGLRIFDVSDPTNPKFLTSVYQDCGSHTNTLYPDRSRGRLLVLVSSYPLRPGPTCGQVNGPRVGRDPLHGVIQVVEIPLAHPERAHELTELPITYPGDPDNRFVWAEHGLSGPGLEPAARACHDIAVYLPQRLVAGACIEQAQLWRLDANGLPDTAHPLWVFDNPKDTDGPGGGDTAADFWHSATFTWDGKIVNFSDESFGDGCPPVSQITDPATGVTSPSDTGRTYFLDRTTGTELSQFMIPRPEAGAYCSTHQGNVALVKDRYLLVQAWYMGGADVIDFTDPTNPQEVAFYDAAPDGPTGSDNWSHYWYQGPRLAGGGLVTYGQDGVHNPPTGRGFEVFHVNLGVSAARSLGHLNPQTQEVSLR